MRRLNSKSRIGFALNCPFSVYAAIVFVFLNIIANVCTALLSNAVLTQQYVRPNMVCEKKKQVNRASAFEIFLCL